MKIKVALILAIMTAAVTDTVRSETLLIKRSDRSLQLLHDSKRVTKSISVGLGRGGQKVKTSMSDHVTPTGDFKVDVILTRDPKFNAIDESSKAKYLQDAKYRSLVNDGIGLARLFENMLSLDFDGDGLPDRAYGAAYIGLDSDSAITGPKLKMFGTTPYWYSIALHGTPRPEKDIGAMNSGGCIHVPEGDLLSLIKSGQVHIGTTVHIID